MAAFNTFNAGLYTPHTGQYGNLHAFVYYWQPNQLLAADDEYYITKIPAGTTIFYGGYGVADDPDQSFAGVEEPYFNLGLKPVDPNSSVAAQPTLLVDEGYLSDDEDDTFRTINMPVFVTEDSWMYLTIVDYPLEQLGTLRLRMYYTPGDF